jgi:hypothetical protein
MTRVRTPTTPHQDAMPPRTVTPAEWFRCGLNDAIAGNDPWPPKGTAEREQYLAGYAVGVKSC